MSNLRSTESLLKENDGVDEDRRPRLARAVGARCWGDHVFFADALEDLERVLPERLPVGRVLREACFGTYILLMIRLRDSWPVRRT